MNVVGPVSIYSNDIDEKICLYICLMIPSYYNITIIATYRVSAFKLLINLFNYFKIIQWILTNITNNFLPTHQYHFIMFGSSEVWGEVSTGLIFSILEVSCQPSLLINSYIEMTEGRTAAECSEILLLHTSQAQSKN